MIFKVLTGLLVLCFMLSAIGTAVAKPASEGAFLTDFAGNISQVVNQVEGNRLIALRYAKHFRTEPSAVLAYFRNELSVIALEENVTLNMFYLDESRNIVSAATELRAGTKVFANRAGTPILEYGSGNPLAGSLTETNLRQLANAANTGQENVVTQVLGQPPMELTPVTNPAETGTLVAANPIGTAPTPSPTGAGNAGVGSFSKYLVPLGVVGAAAALAGGGGGSNAIGPPNNGEDPVPEPTGFIVLGSSLVTVSAMWYRRRKS